jgi:hypothetical protein
VLLSGLVHQGSVGLRPTPYIGNTERLPRPDPLLPERGSLSGVKAGLCDTCTHQKLIRSGRGSEFSMCLLHKTDERFPKYPRIPVERCAGYDPRRPSASR